MNRCLLMVGMLFVTDCATVHKRATPEAIVAKPAWHKEFHQSKLLFDQGQFQAAADGFSAYLERYTATPYVLSARFYLGRSFEQMGRSQDAVAQYRSILDLSQETDPEQQDLRTQALHRLTFCYEVLGEDEKLIASLLDLKKQAQFVAPLVAEVELPARLAASYSRAGNAQQAQIYFKQAETAFQKLHSQATFEQQRPWLAETLLAMGKAALSSVTPLNLAERAENVKQGQRYLIRAIELDVAPHSQQAFELLSSSYRGWVGSLNDSELEGTLKDSFALRSSRQERLKTAKALAALLEEAKLNILPSPSSSASIWETQLRSDLDELEKGTSQVLYRGTPETLLTPDAYRREGELTNVRLVDPPAQPKRKKSKGLSLDPNL